MSKKIPHIKVDAFPIVDKHFSGIGHYTLGIIKGFDELAGEGKLTYSLIVPVGLSHKIHQYQLEHYTRIIRNPISNKVVNGSLKENLKFPLNIFTGPGCYYFPSFLAWPISGGRSSVVIHDASFLSVPQCVEKANRKFLAKVMPNSVANADNVIAISEFGKSEIMKYYKVPENKISIAVPSVDRTHFYKRSSEEVKKVKAKYDIFSEKYIFSVGNIEPRKNYEKLIDAYIKLPRKITDEYPLVIVGAGGWNNKNILDKIQKAKENGYRIINPKYFVLDKDMPALYTGAQFFVYPSIYEGFGMPPLEAYACGTPVLTSNVASLPEAAGKAAVYLDPFDEKDILEKMKKMIKLTEENRDQFLPAINEHLKKFSSWRASAEITAASVTGLPLETFR